jgi:hypothetical protein
MGIVKNEQVVCGATFSYRSVFDVLLDNLRKSRMVNAIRHFFTPISPRPICSKGEKRFVSQLIPSSLSQQVHLYRIVYVGEHDGERLEDLQQYFSAGTSQVNFKSGESHDVLCALLIHYAKHFILMLEV